MNDFTSRREALQEQISDLEAALAGLKAQLESESEREQHEAIDRLEEFLGEIDNKHANLQDFWKILRDEIRNLFGEGSSKTGTGS